LYFFFYYIHTLLFRLVSFLYLLTWVGTETLWCWYEIFGLSLFSTQQCYVFDTMLTDVKQEGSGHFENNRKTYLFSGTTSMLGFTLWCVQCQLLSINIILKPLYEEYTYICTSHKILYIMKLHRHDRSFYLNNEWVFEDISYDHDNEKLKYHLSKYQGLTGI
jgi:hypothetical protein